jgi:TRAP-type mannitol/chloroaromatic compound transport system substrate-binding protein
MLSAYVNINKWNELPKAYQAAFENACAKAHTSMVSRYDALNPKALRELAAAGTKLMAFPQAVMEACFTSAHELYAETAAKNPKFKKVYEPWKAFRAEQVLWFRVAEGTFDNFMFRASAQNKL